MHRRGKMIGIGSPAAGRAAGGRAVSSVNAVARSIRGKGKAVSAWREQTSSMSVVLSRSDLFCASDARCSITKPCACMAS
jgi:hypothetical protein